MGSPFSCVGRLVESLGWSLQVADEADTAARRLSAGAHPAPWHFFHFLPLPQVHGSFLPGVFSARTGSFFGAAFEKRRTRASVSSGVHSPSHARTTSRGK